MPVNYLKYLKLQVQWPAICGVMDSKRKESLKAEIINLINT